MWPLETRKQAVEQLVAAARALVADSDQFIVRCREISALVGTVDPEYADETLCFFVRLDVESLDLAPAEISAEPDASRRAALLARQREFLSRYRGEGVEAAHDVLDRFARAA